MRGMLKEIRMLLDVQPLESVVYAQMDRDSASSVQKIRLRRKAMNRAERRALGVPKTVASNIEEAEKRRTVNTYSVAVASVLWDMNKDKEEVQSIIGKILDRFDTIKKDYATMEDYRIMLREEAGIEIKYC